MSIADSILPEFDVEMASTRKVLERVPTDRFDWRPHAKSYTLGELATHIANLPVWGSITVKQNDFELSTAGKTPLASSSEELVSRLDKNVQDTRSVIETTTDTSFMEPWSLLMNGKAVFTMPRIAVYRSMVMNHIIHHRAQLTVYLRLLDVPVPGIYGPSADEPF